MRRFVTWTLSVIPLLLLISCNPAAQPGPQRNSIQQPPAPITGQGKQTAEQDQPQLAGGSETTERYPHPVSNYLLQRKYPSVLVLRGALNKNKIALTWDDGPDRRFTPQVLDVLKKYNVKGTFFVMGSRAAAHPDVIRRIQREGHVIGNHTYWHPNLTKSSVGAMKWEINETDKVIQNLTGSKPRLFRAPYGNLNDELVKELGRMNKKAVGWSVDSLDWRQLPADEVERNVLSNVHPGAIILMHSGGHWTQDLSGMVKALDQIIPKLKKDGMQFVTIPELVR